MSKQFPLWRLWIGSSLIILGLMLPAVLTVENLHVQITLISGLVHHDALKVLDSAFRLVFLNTVRACPHYLGAFFVAAHLSNRWKGWRRVVINFTTVGIIITMVYVLIDKLYHIHYDFGAPALTVMLIQILLISLSYHYVGEVRKIPIILLVLMGFQFLDLVPAMNALPFGRGETSQDIKMASQILEMETFLDTTMFFFCFVCLGLASVLLMMIRNENRRWELNQLKLEHAKVLADARLKEVEQRSMWELQHLVHDLKTPLTTIQTLSYVVKLHCVERDDIESGEYLEWVEDAVDTMHDMISEILHEDQKTYITSDALMDIVLAQLSTTAFSQDIQLENKCPHASIYVNRVRLARSIVNLVDNAYQARSERPFRMLITIQLCDVEQDTLLIRIADNGIGIAPEKLLKIWDSGVSYQGSSGLGLTFVRETIRQADGDITLSSTLDVGTTFTISLPIKEGTHVEETYNPGD